MLKRSTPLRRKTADTLTVPVWKPRACKVCRERFTPTRQMQPVCSPPKPCSFEYGLKAASKSADARVRAEKREHRQKLESIKPLSYWEKKAEAAVNRYVRLRDASKGCVSCDLPATWDGQWHASHFRSVGAATAVRFNLWNINKACSVCNHHKSGNLAEYEPRLRALRGDEKVDWLRTQNQIVKYSREYLERLQKVFNKKARRQEKRNG
jgi:hypothetical protein